MIDFLYAVDVAVFHIINGVLANPVGDFLWPFITDWDRLLPVRLLLAGVWLWMVIKGGIRGRTAALLLLSLIILSDQVNSSVVKELFARPRPCHEIGGIPVVQGIHMLVGCGPGKSFPSSHAVNNFAVATLLAFYYRRWRWAFLGWAGLVALSRVAVGVHYPSDIIAGALFGAGLAYLLIGLWILCQRRLFPSLTVDRKAAS